MPTLPACKFTIDDSPTFEGWYLGQWGSGEFASVAVSPETLARIREWNGDADDNFADTELRDGLYVLGDSPVTIVDMEKS